MREPRLTQTHKRSQGDGSAQDTGLFAPSIQTDSRIQGVSHFDAHVSELCEDESQLLFLGLLFCWTRSRLQQRAYTRQEYDYWQTGD